mmetsp:Transcript_31784/g.53613  ORF Transcript_31784/g.53613 Transcript_31784/m.53613 type:complete len:675 (+) Transcript_31784:9-2033(+)
MIAFCFVLGVFLYNSADGLEFTINQKEYKAKTFKLYGVEFKDTQGFVDENALPLDNRGYSEVRTKCNFEADSIPFHEYSKFSTVIYNPNNEVYDKFQGIDLIPENHEYYSPGSQNQLKLRLDKHKKYQEKPFMFSRCRLANEDGTTWHVTRVGPFKSVGGYDWWQISYPDVGLISEALAKHPEGVDMLRNILVSTDKDGNRLAYPPIHTHHIHIVPQPGTRPRLQDKVLCVSGMGLGISALDELVRDRDCMNMSWFMEQHGDAMSKKEDDGVETFTVGDGISPRRYLQPVDFEGEFNDVRPVNSEPMEWYHEVAVLWKPADHTVAPVSDLVVLGSPHVVIPSQLTKAGAVPNPSDEESVMIFTVKIPEEVEGKLIKGKLHSHVATLEASALFLATLDDLGVAGDHFVPEFAWKPQRTSSELGFSDNEHFFAYAMDNLKRSQERYDRICAPSSSKTNLKHDPICHRPRPELICAAQTVSEDIIFEGQSYPFDRRSNTFCKPWHLRGGDDIVAFGFGRKVTSPPAPSAPNVIPKYLSSHTVYILYFEQEGRVTDSYHNVVMTTYNGAFVRTNAYLTPFHLTARGLYIAFYEGPPLNESDLIYTTYALIALFTTILCGAVLSISLCCRHGWCKCNQLASTSASVLSTVTTNCGLWMRWFRNDRSEGKKYELVPIQED